MAAGAVLALALAACGGNITSSGVTNGTSTHQAAKPSQPLWKAGGALLGDWPPTASPPARWRYWRLPDATDSEGYRWQFTLAVGPALHYRIPAAAQSCGNPGIVDLPPGQYAVPWALIIHNPLGQQETSGSDVLLAEYTARTPKNILGYVSGWNLNTDSNFTSEDGSCPDLGVYISAHGTWTQYGLIDPAGATPSLLRKRVIYANYRGQEDPAGAKWRAWLKNLMPPGGMPS
jgi:hypothetical protein